MTIDDEVRRTAQLLEALIQVTGVSQEEVETRLEASPGYVGRLLGGRVELKLRHILAILRILEIEPSLFFQTLYPEARPAGGVGGTGGVGTSLDELRQRLDALGLGGQPSPSGPEIGVEDLEGLVQGAVLAALSRKKPKG